MDNNAETTNKVTEVPTTMPEAPIDAQGGWMSMVPIVLIFFVMYFLLIRPQEKKRRELEEMVKQAKKGDNVITTGGIYGVITKMDEKEGVAFIEVSKDVQVKVLKSSIAEVLGAKKEVSTKK